jgi:hypothetical protein
MRNVLSSALLVCIAWSTTACQPAVAVSRAVEIESIASAWIPPTAPSKVPGLPGAPGLPVGTTKIVPAIWLRVKNVSGQKLVSLQVNAVFHRVGEVGEWGSAFATVAGSQGLPPGASSNEVGLASALGYTGAESESELLENSEFVDASVDIFVKYASAQWTRVAQVPIARRLVYDVERRN